MLVVGALVVLIPGLDLLPLIIASQNLQGLLLPVVLVFMVLLVNDRRLMGRHATGASRTCWPGRAVGLVVVARRGPARRRRPSASLGIQLGS